MATQKSTTGKTLANVIKVHYDKDLIEHAEAKVYYYQFAEKRPIPKNAGKTIEFTVTRAIPTGGKISEGATPTQKSLSADKITLTLHQLGDWVSVSDYVDFTAITPMVGNAIKKFRDQAPRTIDKFIQISLYVVADSAKRTAIAGVLYNTYNTSVAAGVDDAPLMFTGQASYDGFPIYMDKSRQSGVFDMHSVARTSLSVKTIRKAVLELRNRSIEPMADGNYMAITHPGAIESLRADTTWKAWHQYTSPELMAKGEVGQVEGVRFVASPEASRFALTGSSMYASSTALYTTLIFGKGAYGVTELGGLSYHVVDNADSNNPLAMWRTIGWKVAMAATVLNKSAGLIVCSTENTGV